MLEERDYNVKEQILSPHQFGVIPQHRRRIYIVCENSHYNSLADFEFPEPSKNIKCDIKKIIDENDTDYIPIKEETRQQLALWQEFIDLTIAHNQKIPRFPIWAMEFGADYQYKEKAPAFQSLKELN